MKRKFRKISLGKANKARLETINSIIGEYQAQGYVLTLRQLYYQLVSRDVIPNKQAEYSKLSNLLKEGRMAGVVDWSAIEDRLRKPEKPAGWDSPKEILEACINQYQRNRMDNQDNYLEVWVEKDALSGVLSRVTEQYHVPIMVNRGYSSASAMFDAYNRFAKRIEEGNEVKIIYLGDHDPSGLDMIRDIRERILEFFLGEAYKFAQTFEQWMEDSDYTEQDLYAELREDTSVYDDFEFSPLLAWIKYKMPFSVTPIALTKKQIDQYNPPPNPAKITDPRAKDYIKIFGNVSWEVDALKPEVLHSLLDNCIKDNIDFEQYKKMVALEDGDKKQLRKLTNKLK